MSDKIQTVRGGVFTDFVVTWDGTMGEDAMESLASAVDAWADENEAGSAVLGMATHRCNDDGETYHSVLGQRDRLRAGIEALADEWEADSRAETQTAEYRSVAPAERRVSARHARLAHQHASALRALLSANDEKAGA